MQKPGLVANQAFGIVPKWDAGQYERTGRNTRVLHCPLESSGEVRRWSGDRKFKHRPVVRVQLCTKTIRPTLQQLDITRRTPVDALHACVTLFRMSIGERLLLGAGEFSMGGIRSGGRIPGAGIERARAGVSLRWRDAAGLCAADDLRWCVGAGWRRAWRTLGQQPAASWR